jgi:hypothetical protein
VATRSPPDVGLVVEAGGGGVAMVHQRRDLVRGEQRGREGMGSMGRCRLALAAVVGGGDGGAAAAGADGEVGRGGGLAQHHTRWTRWPVVEDREATRDAMGRRDKVVWGPHLTRFMRRGPNYPKGSRCSANGRGVST